MPKRRRPLSMTPFISSFLELGKVVYAFWIFLLACLGNRLSISLLVTFSIAGPLFLPHDETFHLPLPFLCGYLKPPVDLCCRPTELFLLLWLMVRSWGLPTPLFVGFLFFAEKLSRTEFSWVWPRGKLPIAKGIWWDPTLPGLLSSHLVMQTRA